MFKVIALAVILFGSVTNLSAQFTPAFLQNDSYWGDGKAEFNLYDAQIVREGQPRPCEVLHILVREPFDPKQWTKVDDWKRPGVIPVVKLNQILHVPTGIYTYQQMHSSFWKIDNGLLLKWSLTSNDSSGNTFKEMRRFGEQLAFNCTPIGTAWPMAARTSCRLRAVIFTMSCRCECERLIFQNRPPGSKFNSRPPQLIRRRRR